MRIGSLFSGYGGLDMAVQAALGGTVAWYSEIEPAACRVLQAHLPGVPNLGDVTTVDWSQVEPVNVLTGGYPCQPFSHAGKRKGTNDERHLWPYVRDALAALRPMVAVFENVDGHRSLGLADVLGDIADLGMSARWGVVQAADAGAPHGRKRVFIVLHAADADSDGHGGELHARGMGSLEGAAAGDAPERQWPRREPDAGGDITAATDWGKYASAISRWERTLRRPAPAPTILGSNGRPRLSPVFVEWMMGLPEGHVTGHGLSNAQALKMLGNGVVPQQAALALHLLGVAS
jgi:DNA (cytosine-5)-methyltransferase 1